MLIEDDISICVYMLIENALCQMDAHRIQVNILIWTPWNCMKQHKCLWMQQIYHLQMQHIISTGLGFVKTCDTRTMLEKNKAHRACPGESMYTTTCLFHSSFASHHIRYPKVPRGMCIKYDVYTYTCMYNVQNVYLCIPKTKSISTHETKPLNIPLQDSIGLGLWVWMSGSFEVGIHN